MVRPDAYPVMASTRRSSVVQTVRQRDLDLAEMLAMMLQAREPIVPTALSTQPPLYIPLNEDLSSTVSLLSRKSLA
jgi:hypothetical protein